MNRWSTNNNNSRELRLRPPPSSSLSATSTRTGLRNSNSADRDEQPSLPPAKRRRHSYSQNSAHVHVSATVPNLVIAGIRPSQWPSLVPSSASQPPTNGSTPVKSSNEWSRSKRAPARQSAPSRSPRRRRAARDRSYAEYNSDYDATSSSDAAATVPLPTQKFSTSARTSPRQTAKDFGRRNTADSTQKLSLSNGTNDGAHNDHDPDSQDKVAHASEDDADLESKPKKNSSTSTNETPQPASRGISPAVSALADNTIKQPDPVEKTDPDELPDTLPLPFTDRPPAPATFADKAAQLYHERYEPVTTPAAFIDLLTSHDPSQRSTATLLSLAKATHKALVAWQDQYLRLDSKTAPAQNPPKRPATGGRVPLEDRLFENAKEIELWGHILGVEGLEYQGTRRGAYAGLGYDAPAPAKQVNVISADTGEGRRARRRGADAKLTDGVQLSDNEANGNEKRTRKPVRRFDVGTNRGGRRKRARAANEDEDESGSETTEAPTRRKRGRLAQIRDDDEFDSSWSAGEEGLNARSNSAPRSAPTRGRGSGRGRSARGRFQARGSPVISHSDLQAQQQRSRADTPDAALAGSTDATSMPAPAKTAAAGPRRQKAKSEKRSSSMTAWWAERKRKAQEERLRQSRERGAPTESAAPLKPEPSAHVTAAPPPTGGQALMHVTPHSAAPLAPEPPRQTAEYAPRSSIDHQSVLHPVQGSPPSHPHDLAYSTHYRPIHAMHQHHHHGPPPPPPPPPGHGHIGHQHPPPPPPPPPPQAQSQSHASVQAQAQHPPPPPAQHHHHHHHPAWYAQSYAGMPPLPPSYHTHPPPGGAPPPPPPLGPQGPAPGPPPHGHVMQPYGSFRIMNGR